MTLTRLLFRSVRRFSSSSTPFPFHSPFPTSATAAEAPDNRHQYNHQYSNPSTNYQNTAATDTSNHYYNPQSPPAAATATDASSHFYNHQSPPPAAADASNHNYNNSSQFPNTNYHYNPQNTPNYQHKPHFSDQTPNYSSQSTISNPTPTTEQTPGFNNQFPNPIFQTSTSSVPQRSYGFNSAEEAAAERRRRKRRLRIEPPLYALRPNPQTPPPNANNPDKPRLPDSTSALVGNRLNLHNRVQSLIRAGDLDSASYVVRQSVFQYVRPTVFTCNAIIAAMYRAKRYNDAKALFQYFFRQFEIIPNVVSYNNLIASHCELNEVDDALKVYEYILENAPYSPSAVTYRHLTKGLIDAGRIDEAVSMLREMLNKGQAADSLVFNNVILGFLNLGNLEKANELFDELKGRCTVYDGVVNATFMDWFFNQGKPKEAMESYRDLLSRKYRMVPATRNVLLETLLRHGKKDEAWELFHDMLDDHTPPTFQAVNSDTINMMVNECFKEGKVEEAVDVFKRTGKGVKTRPFMMDVAGFNNMMARMCELEMMEEAEQYYTQLCAKSLAPDVNTYKTLIDAYIKLDKVDNMLEKYSKMVEAGLRVIPPYANKWFGFLIEKSRVSDCLPILSRMADGEPKPDVTTYDIVIRGLVEDGNYEATTNVLREMTNHGVGTTASLKEFVLDVFEKQGRRLEIENILNRPPAFSSGRPYQGPRALPRVAGPPETAGGRNPAMPWQTTYPPTTNYANQYEEQTRQPQISSPPKDVDQRGGNPAMPWQTAYSPPTSHANQFADQTRDPLISSLPEKAEQRGENPAITWQSGYSPPMYNENQFAEQPHQRQMSPPPETAEQGGRNSATQWHTANSAQSSYANQVPETRQPWMNSPPEMAHQGGRNPAMQWQTAYSPPSAYSNQFAETHQPGMSSRPHIAQQGERNQAVQWQSASTPHTYANQFAGQTKQPQIIEQVAQSEPVLEPVPLMAGENAA